MTIIPIPALNDNYIWLMINSVDRTAIGVDPGYAPPLLDYLKQQQLTLDAIFLTHHHYDHINGCDELKTAYPGCKVYGPDDFRINCVDAVVADTSVITIDQWQFKIMAVPGHTMTHIAFYEPIANVLFCGDTLFSAGCGRIFEGSVELLAASLAKLSALPNQTRVYCGHEYTRQNLRFALSVEPTNQASQTLLQTLMAAPQCCSLPSTIGREKKINPFLRTNQPEIITYAQKKGLQDLSTLKIFKLLREEKDNFSA